MSQNLVGKMSKDIGMGIRKGTVVSFVPTLFTIGCSVGIPSLYVFSFFKCFFVASRVVNSLVVKWY